jgi:hypothetical protein
MAHHLLSTGITTYQRFLLAFARMGWEEDNLRLQNEQLRRERDEAQRQQQNSSGGCGGCLVILLIVAFAMGWVRCGGC